MSIPGDVESAEGLAAFKTSLQKLKQLKGTYAKEYLLVTQFTEGLQGLADWLNLQELADWLNEAKGPETADFMFQGFSVAVINLSRIAGDADRPWEAEARDHGVYALKHLADVEVPALLAPVDRAPDARSPGTPQFNKVLAEASINLMEILIRAGAKLQPNAGL